MVDEDVQQSVISSFGRKFHNPDTNGFRLSSAFGFGL